LPGEDFGFISKPLRNLQLNPAFIIKLLHLGGNMLTKKKPGRPKGITGQARAITAKELAVVLKVSESSRHPERNYALLILSHYLGLRAQELSLLKIADVFDSTSGELHKTLRLIAMYTKGHVHRDLSLEHKKVVSALEAYIQYRQKKDGKNFNLKAPLFRSERGNHFSPNTMVRVFVQLYQDAGISHASSHSGRRTLITALSEAGVDLYSISKIAGHASVATTCLYIANNPNRLRNILINV
jgi:integrase/recombinase XerD